MNYCLGLDMGTNSVAASALKINQDGDFESLLDLAVRIFQEGVEAKTGVPKNQKRRQMRQVRKNLRRRHEKRDALLRLLRGVGMLPDGLSNKDADAGIWNVVGDPWQLRAKALDEKLELVELARVLLHLCKRRGFKSNRKAVADDEGRVKSAISALREKIHGAQCRTLGEYLSKQMVRRNRAWLSGEQAPELFTDRQMYENEFEQIWERQKAFHADTLTVELKARIFRTLFFQRPLAANSHLIGHCTFEPRRKRSPICYLPAQRARLWQEINHLEIKDPQTLTFKPLTVDEKKLLFVFMDERAEATWKRIRKELGRHDGEVFNLEGEKRSKLKGNTTNGELLKRLGDDWRELSAQQQDDLVVDLYTIEDESVLIRRLCEVWNFSEEQAEELSMKVRLEKGYSRLSAKALKKILPSLSAGKNYHDACQEAGYQRPDQTVSAGVDFLPLPPQLRNPVVQKALYQVRSVVNALIKKHGKPAEICIEMGRDMKLSKKEKEALEQRHADNEKENQRAEDFLKEYGIVEPSRDDMVKYKLWLECKQHCPYTGAPIPIDRLFSGDFQIEHILPWSRTFDDSFANKTLCAAGHNQHVKMSQTPYEAYSGDAQKYEEILQRVRHSDMSPGKKRRFEMKEIPDDFRQRQLNDTRYICTEVKKYLEQLYARDSDHQQVRVRVSKGALTAALRKAWNLNTILSDDGVKNRADHRHHTIDAAVIAATSTKFMQSLSRLSAQVGKDGLASGIWDNAVQHRMSVPWKNFRDDLVKKINALTVSHAPTRHIQGGLHAETALGPTSNPNEFVVRRPLSKITVKNSSEIRDEKVRVLVQERLTTADGDPKKAFAQPLYHCDGKTPIRKVRVLLNYNNPDALFGMQRDGRKYRFYEYANNHHMEIVQDNTTGKWSGIIVTMMEAAQRIRRGENVVKREHGDGKTFIIDICANDMVRLDTDNRTVICRVQKITGAQITLREHTIAKIDGKYDKIGRYLPTPNSFREYKPQKLQISTLGEVTQVTNINYD